MSLAMRIVFFLTGVLTGRTITLRGKYPFVDGKLTLEFPPEEMALHAHSLAVNFSAFPEGSAELRQAQEAYNVQRDLSQAAEHNGGAPVSSGGEPGGEGAATGNAGGDGGGAAGAATGGAESEATAGDGQPESVMLLGSDVQPAEIVLTDSKTVPLGDVVRRAVLLNELTAAEWNALTVEDREAEIADAIEVMRDEAKLSEEPKHEVNEKLKRAVESLDPAVDGDWTHEGLPAMRAVEARYGSAAVTRADVEAVAPGFRRPAKAG